MKKKILTKPIQPDDWKTGTVPATKMQQEELAKLTSKEADGKDLSKAGAAHQIDELKKTTSSKKKK